MRDDAHDREAMDLMPPGVRREPLRIDEGSRSVADLLAASRRRGVPDDTLFPDKAQYEPPAFAPCDTCDNSGDTILCAGCRRNKALIERLLAERRTGRPGAHFPDQPLAGPMAATIDPDKTSPMTETDLLRALRVDQGDALELISADPMPVAYVLMRTDLASMTRGRMCAQAHHASSAMACFLSTKGLAKQEHRDLYAHWMSMTEQDFGTCIVMDGGSFEEIDHIITSLAEDGFPCGWVHDPTYPLRDGAVVHEFAIDTCAWVFGDRNVLIEQFRGELLQ